MKSIFINSATLIKTLTDNFEDRHIGRTMVEMIIAHVLHSKEFNLTESLIEYSGNALLSQMVGLNARHVMKVLTDEIRLTCKAHEINSFHVSKTGVTFYVNDTSSSH